MSTTSSNPTAEVLVTEFMREYHANPYGVVARLSTTFSMKPGTLNARLTKLRMNGLMLPDLPRGRAGVVDIDALNTLVEELTPAQADSEPSEGA